MAKPVKDAPKKLASPNAHAKAPGKLSTGLLGMKFMRREPEAAASNENSRETSVEPIEASAKPQPPFSTKDPSEWSIPGLSRKALLDPASATSPQSVGYADLMGKPSGNDGRRTYGAKPKSIDPEEMVKSYANGERKSQGKEREGKSKNSKKPANKKRLSSEHDSSAPRPKQSRKA